MNTGSNMMIPMIYREIFYSFLVGVRASYIHRTNFSFTKFRYSIYNNLWFGWAIWRIDIHRN
uniref:ORF61a n=1 Tax=Pinus koraiensis TaxID=88728 RepID=Q85WY2_PINKO|nr:ORF61a [Pinus koraiensis]